MRSVRRRIADGHASRNDHHRPPTSRITSERPPEQQNKSLGTCFGDGREKRNSGFSSGSSDSRHAACRRQRALIGGDSCLDTSLIRRRLHRVCAGRHFFRNTSNHRPEPSTPLTSVNESAEGVTFYPSAESRASTTADEKPVACGGARDKVRDPSARVCSPPRLLYNCRQPTEIRGFRALAGHACVALKKSSPNRGHVSISTCRRKVARLAFYRCGSPGMMGLRIAPVAKRATATKPTSANVNVQRSAVSSSPAVDDSVSCGKFSATSAAATATTSKKSVPEWLPSAALTVARSVLRVCALAVPVLLDRHLLRQRLVLVLVPSRGGGGCATLNLVDCDQRRGSAGLLLQVHSHGIPRRRRLRSGGRRCRGCVYSLGGGRGWRLSGDILPAAFAMKLGIRLD
ncbi:hypothetical protein MRX96_014918 [Rhipicephalus microplus]